MKKLNFCQMESVIGGEGWFLCAASVFSWLACWGGAALSAPTGIGIVAFIAGINVTGINMAINCGEAMDE